MKKLIGKLDSDLSADQVHQLRTSARRFGAAFKALALDDAGVPKSFLKELARLRKRAGKVRDMDVLTEFAAAVRPKDERECHVQLLEYLGAQRLKQAGKLHAELRRFGKGVRKGLDQALLQSTKLLGSRDADPAHSAMINAAGTAIRLSARLAAPHRLDKTNLHPYRLKVKELQNVLLMADAPSHSSFVRDLGCVKDAIGVWHDWQELTGIAAKLARHKGKCLLLAELKEIAENKYDYALTVTRKLRKTYLQSPDRTRKASAKSGVPRAPVWEATARLAK